jgi:hypothetical protein
MKSVGSIDPDGMLNGWITKLLSAQVRITTDSRKRVRLHALSGFACLAVRGREVRDAIRPSVWRH